MLSDGPLPSWPFVWAPNSSRPSPEARSNFHAGLRDVTLSRTRQMLRNGSYLCWCIISWLSSPVSVVTLCRHRWPRQGGSELPPSACRTSTCPHNPSYSGGSRPSSCPRGGFAGSVPGPSPHVATAAQSHQDPQPPSGSHLLHPASDPGCQSPFSSSSLLTWSPPPHPLTTKCPQGIHQGAYCCQSLFGSPDS